MGYGQTGYIKQGDCLSLLADVADESVDMVLTDLPYGKTKNKWDKPIPLEPLWSELSRVVKKRGAVVMFSQMPFTAELVMSNRDMFKYEWIWTKENGTGFLNSHFAPLKIHENILVFSKSAACYVKDPANAMIYNPQMRTGFKPYKAKHGGMSENYDVNWTHHTETESNGERYPIDVIKYGYDKEKFHPTQKPVELCKYLINTYTQPGDTVLDVCMGSGNTCIAAKEEGRRYIGFEINEEYFKIAQERLGSKDEISNSD